MIDLPSGHKKYKMVYQVTDSDDLPKQLKQAGRKSIVQGDCTPTRGEVQANG